MVDNTVKNVPAIDLTPTNSLLGGSPKGMYVFFLLALCKNYFECMRAGPESNDIEAATAALIAFCPNRAKREEIWAYYIKTRDEQQTSHLSASVYAIGELVSYLSETLEFEETSTGGLM